MAVFAPEKPIRPWKTLHTEAEIVPAEAGEKIKLQRYLSRPAGYAFLGSMATTVQAEVSGARTDVIIDSRLDITLVSGSLIAKMNPKLKIKPG